MRSAIFSLLPVRRGSTIASIRIGCWLSNLLSVPIFDDDKILEGGDLDNLFIINGSTLYCKYLTEIAAAVERAANIFWIQNDYTLPPPAAESEAISPFRRAFAKRNLIPHYWTTCEKNARKTAKSAYVNWNVLGFAKNARRASLVSARTLYYGAYREGRKDAFEAVYRAFEGLPLAISSTSKKFSDRPDCLLISPFRDNLHLALSVYGMGIYIQDKKSIAGYTSPATRFYEMLSVGLPMVFTPDCVQTLDGYGYNVSSYVVTPKTARELVENRVKIANEQSAWEEDFESKLADQVKELYAQNI